jgi:hypothetical protein
MRTTENINTLNSEVGQTIVIVAVVITLFIFVQPVRRVAAELKFYRANNWDLWLDSKNECWMQDFFVQRFPHWPIGKTKILAESVFIGSQLAVIAGVLLAAFAPRVNSF